MKPVIGINSLSEAKGISVRIKYAGQEQKIKLLYDSYDPSRINLDNRKSTIKCSTKPAPAVVSMTSSSYTAILYVATPNILCATINPTRNLKDITAKIINNTTDIFRYFLLLKKIINNGIITADDK